MPDDFQDIFQFNESTLNAFKALTRIHTAVHEFYIDPTQDNADQLVDQVRDFELQISKMKINVGKIVKGIATEDTDGIQVVEDENGFRL